MEVEGVIFDVIAPPDFLDDDNLEPFENDEWISLVHDANYIVIHNSN